MSRELPQKSVTPREILQEGPSILGILLIWGVLAGLARYGVGNVGFAQPGQFFFIIGRFVAMLFLLAGIASVLLFVIARGMQLSEK